jgi:hypothetical protein
MVTELIDSCLNVHFYFKVTANSPLLAYHIGTALRLFCQIYVAIFHEWHAPLP